MTEKEQGRREAVRAWYKENSSLTKWEFAKRDWLCTHAYVDLMYGAITQEYREAEDIPAKPVCWFKNGRVPRRRCYRPPAASRELRQEWFRRTYRWWGWFADRLSTWIEALPVLYYYEDSGYVTQAKPESHWFDGAVGEWVETDDNWTELNPKTVAGLIWGETLVKHI